jgi:hypothetical protein
VTPAGAAAAAAGVAAATAAGGPWAGVRAARVAWGLRRRPPRPRPTTTDGEWWGYEFPWAGRDEMAYVGITGRTVAARWADDDHHAQRPDVDTTRAVTYRFASEAEADRWETARIYELAMAGHRLLNLDKNPRPCWELHKTP